MDGHDIFRSLVDCMMMLCSMDEYIYHLNYTSIHVSFIEGNFGNKFMDGLNACQT